MPRKPTSQAIVDKVRRMIESGQTYEDIGPKSGERRKEMTIIIYSKTEKDLQGQPKIMQSITVKDNEYVKLEN